MEAFLKKLNMLRGGFVFFLLTLICVPHVSFAASGQGKLAHTGISISVIYGIIAGISLLLLIGYGALVKNKVIWLLLLFASIFLVNLGYFSLSISRTLGEALLANRIAYLGSVFLPFFMLMTIMGICRYPCRNWLVGLMLCINVIVFLIAASPGYTGWYYEDVVLVFGNGAAKLEKVYGPLHKIYYVYLFSYFAGMVGVICSSVRKKRVNSPKQAVLLLVVVLLNILFWLVEQLVHLDFEFLSISYIISEMLLLCLYSMLQDIEEIQMEMVGLNTEQQTELHNKEYRAEETPFDIEKAVAFWAEEANLSNRERDVFLALLEDKKRKEIAEELHISENTVKTHTSNVFSKMEVSTRSELIEKVFK